MRLADCQIEKLLPLFMREEADNIALARALDPVVRDFGNKIKWCSDFENIDHLPEPFLDALASELGIDWYKRTADIDVKRELVRNSDLVHRTLGTKYAVEQVVADYYGDAKVVEWWEYDGEPGHFKISVSEDKAKIVFPEELYLLISKVKKASAILDGVDFNWTNYQKIYGVVASTQVFRQPEIIVTASDDDLSWLSPLTFRVGIGQHYTEISPSIITKEDNDGTDI